MRLFIALDLPPAERVTLWDSAATLRAAARGVSWVPAARLHLSLKFLGERPESEVPAFAAALTGAAARARAFSLPLGGGGVFPNARSPRVVWLGAAGDPHLELLHHDVERACAALGCDLEGRPFRPHITLGRVRDRLSAPAARALVAAAETVAYRGTLAVDCVDLMASERSATGLRYRVVSTSPLGGA